GLDLLAVPRQEPGALQGSDRGLRGSDRDAEGGREARRPVLDRQREVEDDGREGRRDRRRQGRQMDHGAGEHHEICRVHARRRQHQGEAGKLAGPVLPRGAHLARQLKNTWDPPLLATEAATPCMLHPARRRCSRSTASRCNTRPNVTLSPPPTASASTSTAPTGSCCLVHRVAASRPCSRRWAATWRPPRAACASRDCPFAGPAPTAC